MAAATGWFTGIVECYRVSVAACQFHAGRHRSASAWQARVEQIRKLEELHGTVDQVLNDSPDSMWGQVLRAYRLAEQGNWDQAELLLKPFLEDPAHPFISALGAAVQARSALPQLSGLPIESF